MNFSAKPAALRLALLAFAVGPGCAAALAQAIPVVDTSVPIVVKAVKPRNNTHFAKFEGTVMNATIAQITVRAKDNELAIQSFPLSREASAKMQKIIDQGGYQYGDKVTVYFDPATRRAVKIKGKPSKPI